MMGRLEGGMETLFYAFSLEDVVPTDHLLRKIDPFLDFDELRAHLKLDRLRRRGPNGARDEFLLAATAQNLRKLAKLVPKPSPPCATYA